MWKGWSLNCCHVELHTCCYVACWVLGAGWRVPPYADVRMAPDRGSHLPASLFPDFPASRKDPEYIVHMEATGWRQVCQCTAPYSHIMIITIVSGTTILFATQLLGFWLTDYQRSAAAAATLALIQKSTFEVHNPSRRGCIHKIPVHPGTVILTLWNTAQR